MEKKVFNIRPFQILGLSTRTNNLNEMNAKTAKIGQLVNRYRAENIANDIPHCKNPGLTFSVYSDYANKEFGDYTYLIGEEVFSLDDVPPRFKLLSIPAGKYVRFTTKPGKMPDVVINAWLEIWRMSNKELGGQRSYIADFEIYDKRAVDPDHSVVDIYIGIK